MSGKNHIMRVKTEEWVRQVFEVKKYYTGMITVKGWKPGSAVLFLRKVGQADSIIGYGTVARIQGLDEMSEEERTMCRENGWEMAVTFSDVKQLASPLPVKETKIGNWEAKGRYLHGRTLSDEVLESILSKAE
ncbi:MAG: hypothetical protein U9O89_01055 [Thermoproteota archaeon]|nr:hypothetical protein [Thermoproteota archaeon]